MNLENLPERRGRDHRGLVFALLLLCVVVGYVGWTVASSSFDAQQARLHPILAPKVIIKQLADSAPLSEWNMPLWSLAVTMLWFVGLWTLGHAMLHMLKINLNGGVAARGLLAFSLAFTVAGWFTSVIGHVGLSQFPTIPIIFALGIALCWRSKPIRDQALELPRAAIWCWSTSTWLKRIVTVVLLLAIALLVVPACTPPIQSDGVRYHLGAPQEYLKAGTTTYLPLNAYSNMPFLVEMHFMGALALNAAEASQLMHMVLALITALGVFAVSRELWHCSANSASQARAISLLPALMYLGIPASAVLATWPFTDHGIALMLICSTLCALYCIKTTPSLKMWAFYGIILGGLIGTKYTMAPLAVVMYAATIFHSWRRQTETRNAPSLLIKASAAAAITATITGGIWFLFNWLKVGNPFYPFATSLFPGGEWGPANDAFLNARAGAKGFGKDFGALLKVPVDATFSWVRFEAHNPGPAWFAGLLCLICGATYSWRSGQKHQLIFMIIVIVCGFLIWFFSYQSNRLMLPVFALLFASAPVPLIAINRWAARVSKTAVVIFLTAGLGWAIQWSWVATALSPPPLLYITGQLSADSYRYRSLTYARAFDYLNKHVQPDERVLLVGEHRIYGAQFTALWSDWFDTPALAWILRQNHLSTTDELLAWLRENNIHWVMINEAELKPQLERDFRPWFSVEEWQIFEELRRLDRPDVDVIKLPPGATILRLKEQS